MSEIIISFPYKKLVMPRNCCHCGDYNASNRVEIGRPSPKIVDSEQEGGTIVRKTRRIDIPIFLCEKCLKKLKEKKKLISFSSITVFLAVIIGMWYIIMPSIYNISQDYKGHIAGLAFFLLGLFSIISLFFVLGIPAFISNHFTGIQILVYNPHRIIIRFYNMDFANKFFDLNGITSEHIIKKKE
ncbi:MAG: hypothetical protein HY934_06550 [Candidatus Firestonebacteria bacterium]|nr:hypothetical protein [Candidatus Firestonebacteria bacterium]